MTVQRITELKRLGSGVLEDTPVAFEWDHQTHSAMQDDLNLELQVNTVREMPAGAEKPVEQILSTEWTPFEIHGEWKDKWAGRGFAMNTFLEFARLVGRAPLVRFELGQHSLVGIITKLRIRYRTDFEIGWGVMFSPHENETVGQARRPPTTAPVAKPITQRLADLEDGTASLRDSADLVAGVPTATEDIDDSTRLIGDLEDAVDRANAASDAISLDDAPVTLALDSVDRAQMKLAAVASAFRACSTTALNASDGVAALSAVGVLPYDDVVIMLRLEEYIRSTRNEAIRVSAVARAGEADARARMARKPRAVHRCRDGESLERISTRYYGTPDQWRLIYDANNLHSIFIAGGTDLIIPERTR